MSLPWVKAPVGYLLNQREDRMLTGRAASHSEALLEIAALWGADRIASISERAMADSLRWSRGKLRRVVRKWESAGLLDFMDEPHVISRCPSWRTKNEPQVSNNSKKLEEDANHKRTTNGPQTDHKRTYYARSLPKEEEREEEQDSLVGQGSVLELLNLPVPPAYPVSPKTLNVPEWVKPVWADHIRATGRKVNGSAPALTSGRLSMLSKCAATAGEMTGDDGREALGAYLREIPQVPKLAWMFREGPPSIETAIKPQKVRNYIEQWQDWRNGLTAPQAQTTGQFPRASSGLHPDTAEAERILNRAIKRTRKGPVNRQGERRWWFTPTAYDPPATAAEKALDSALVASVADLGGWTTLSADSGYQSASERRHLSEVISSNLRQRRAS